MSYLSSYKTFKSGTDRNPRRHRASPRTLLQAAVLRKGGFHQPCPARTLPLPLAVGTALPAVFLLTEAGSLSSVPELQPWGTLSEDTKQQALQQRLPGARRPARLPAAFPHGALPCPAAPHHNARCILETLFIVCLVLGCTCLEGGCRSASILS